MTDKRTRVSDSKLLESTVPSDDGIQLRPYLAGISAIHHLLTGYSCWNKGTSFMQRPYDHDFDARDKVGSGLTWIDQTKWSIGSDITAK